MVIYMNISQEEIWLVEFFPKVGSEITKLRPAIVVSHNEIGRLPLKTIVPITDWKTNYKTNGLSKISAIDCFQIKNFANERFVEKIGIIESTLLEEVHQTIVKTLNPLYAIDII